MVGVVVDSNKNRMTKNGISPPQVMRVWCGGWGMGFCWDRLRGMRFWFVVGGGNNDVTSNKFQSNFGIVGFVSVFFLFRESKLCKEEL